MFPKNRFVLEQNAETAIYSTSAEEKIGFSQHNDEFFSYNEPAKKRKMFLKLQDADMAIHSTSHRKEVFPEKALGFPHKIKVFLSRRVFPNNNRRQTQ